MITVSKLFQQARMAFADGLWASPLGIGLLDRDLRFVDLNESLARMNGLSIEAHLGRTPMDLLPGVSVEIQEALRSVVRTGTPVVGHEFVIETPAMPGVRRVWLETYVPVRDAAGDVQAVSIIVTEVTARRAAEDHERQLQVVSAALSAAVTEQDVAETIVKEALRTLGADRGLLFVRVGDALSIAASAGAAAGHLAAWSRIPVTSDTPVAQVAVSGKPMYVCDVGTLAAAHPRLARAARKSGISSLAVTPVDIGDERAVLVLGFATARSLDVEERSWIESLGTLCGQAIERARMFEAERDLRATFEHVLEQLPHGVMVVDTGGRVVIANSAIASLFGTSIGRGEPIEAVAALPRLHLNGQPYRADEAPVVRTLRTGETVRDEEMLVPRPDGSRRWVETSSTPVRDASGSVIGAAVVGADVTKRRAAEGIRDAFLGVLSHELRTPITSIYGGTQLLLKHGRMDETQRTIAEDVAAEAERMRRLVEDLLVIARFDHGTLVAEREPLMIERLVAAVIAEERRLRPSVECSTTVDPGIPFVAGDESFVRQILRNLVSNAMKYGGGLPIEVFVESGREAGTVTVRVCDRGQGIPQEDVRHVFDLFYRSPAAAKKAVGVGIGLFVARSLTEALGGRIAVTGRDGGGTEFSVTLPTVPDDGVA